MNCYNRFKELRIKFRKVMIYCFFKGLFKIFKTMGLYKKVYNDNVLVVDQQIIGDSVMVSIIFENIGRGLQPKNIIDILCCNEPVQEIYRRNKFINKIFTIDRFAVAMKKSKLSIFHSKTIYGIFYGLYCAYFSFKNLRNKYKTLIVPIYKTDTIYTAIIALMSGIEDRYSFSEKNFKDKSVTTFWWDKYFTRTFLYNISCNECEKFLYLIKAIGYKIIQEKISLKYKKLDDVFFYEKSMGRIKSLRGELCLLQ